MVSSTLDPFVRSTGYEYDPDPKGHHEYIKLVCEAVRSKKLVDLVGLLRGVRSDEDHQPVHGKSLSPRTQRRLLNHGDSTGKPPLIIAVEKGDLVKVCALLEAGAYPECIATNGDRPSDLARDLIARGVGIGEEIEKQLEAAWMRYRTSARNAAIGGNMAQKVKGYTAKEFAGGENGVHKMLVNAREKSKQVEAFLGNFQPGISSGMDIDPPAQPFLTNVVRGGLNRENATNDFPVGTTSFQDTQPPSKKTYDPTAELSDYDSDVQMTDLGTVGLTRDTAQPLAGPEAATKKAVKRSDDLSDYSEDDNAGASSSLITSSGTARPSASPETLKRAPLELEPEAWPAEPDLTPPDGTSLRPRLSSTTDIPNPARPTYPSPTLTPPAPAPSNPPTPLLAPPFAPTTNPAPPARAPQQPRRQIHGPPYLVLFKGLPAAAKTRDLEAFFKFGPQLYKNRDPKPSKAKPPEFYIKNFHSSQHPGYIEPPSWNRSCLELTAEEKRRCIDFQDPKDSIYAGVGMCCIEYRNEEDARMAIDLFGGRRFCAKDVNGLFYRLIKCESRNMWP